MRNIKIEEWKSFDKDKKEVTEDTLMLLSILVTNTAPEDMPRGYLQFQLFTKLTRAFEKAAETRVLILEEDVYKFLRNTVEKNIPSVWGTNSNIVNAIESFMNIKED